MFFWFIKRVYLQKKKLKKKMGWGALLGGPFWGNICSKTEGWFFFKKMVSFIGARRLNRFVPWDRCLIFKKQLTRIGQKMSAQALFYDMGHIWPSDPKWEKWSFIPYSCFFCIIRMQSLSNSLWNVFKCSLKGKFLIFSFLGSYMTHWSRQNCENLAIFLHFA